MRTIFLIGAGLIFLVSGKSIAQLSGTVHIPATYSTLATFISTLNQQGVSGPLWVAVSAGYQEQVPVGGLSLTASGASSTQICFYKNGNGANPRLYAHNGGTGTPGSANQDGIWKFIGSDYVTVDGFDLLDTNTASPKTTEFGFGFFKASTANGCQHNTIKNCVVTLSRFNNAQASGAAADGSRAINMVNALATAQTTSLVVSTAAGSNSYNHFYANCFQNCNIGVFMSGYPDGFPYTLSDQGNELGGNTPLSGNKILNLGGGLNGNPSFGIKTFSQYNLNIAYNLLVSSTNSLHLHNGIIKGIYTGIAPGANLSIQHNTITLHGGGTNQALYLIENASGSGANNNNINISYNTLIGSTYNTATSASFYGIYNSAAATHVFIEHNHFENNSTGTTSGNTYLIYNNAAVSGSISLSFNKLSFAFEGTVPYTGNLYAVYNNGAATTATCYTSANYFSAFYFGGAIASGNSYFIYHTADCAQLHIDGNEWRDLFLYHSGNEYFMYNASSTQSLLSVSNNSIHAVKRTAPAGNMYLYYAGANSPGTAVQTFSNNLFSDITAPFLGSGSFYGIYNAEGNAAPYPKKYIVKNRLENIVVNASGPCYGIYCSGMGDAGSATGSEIHGNVLKNISVADILYGISVSGAGSSLFMAAVHNNSVLGLYTSGSNASVYGAYLGNTHAGIRFYRNRISNLTANGTGAAVYGIYGTSATNAFFANNLVANLSAPVASGPHRVNGIYLNAGASYDLSYNTVLLQTGSSGNNFGSNALYAVTTISLQLKNNILINKSTASGTGLCTAYRRSSSNITTYLAGSDHNLFFAGTPGSSNLIFYNGSSAYQTLSTYQAAMASRDQASVTHDPVLLSLGATSPYFLHVSSGIASPIESGAVGSTLITEDCDLQIRQGALGYLGSGTAPDIGADEFEQNLTPCSGVSAPLVASDRPHICANEAYTVYASSFATGTGYSFQWKWAQQSGGPYVPMVGGTGATSLEFVSGAAPSGTYYLVLEQTCANTAQTAQSAALSITVHPLPTSSTMVNPSLLCAGDTLVLSASSSGATSWQWEGPQGYVSLLQHPSLPNAQVAATGVYTLTASSAYCSAAPITLSVTVVEPSLLIQATNTLVCLGSSTTLTALSSAQNYAWTNGSTTASTVLSPTMSSTYAVTVTDTMGCSVTRTIALTVLHVSIQAVDALICQSPGFATVSVNAFSAATINWYATASATNALASGPSFSFFISTDSTVYAQAIDLLSGCQSVRIPVSASVSAPPQLSISASTQYVCPGKTINLSATGASSYSWAGIGTGPVQTVAPTTSTVYVVNASNSSGCVAQASVAVYTFSLPSISASAVHTLVCPSQSLQLSATGANSYTWNTGTVASSATVYPAANVAYTVYGTDTNGCVGQTTLAIATKTLPLIQVQSSHDTICTGETVTLLASGGTSYTWIPGNQSAPVLQVNVTTTSVFNVIGSGVNSCTNVAFALINVNECLGLPIQQQSLWNVFPNPATDFFYLQGVALCDEPIKLIIVDGTGSQVYRKQIVNTTGSIRVDTQTFGPGLYQVIVSDIGRTTHARLVITEKN